MRNEGKIGIKNEKYIWKREIEKQTENMCLKSFETVGVWERNDKGEGMCRWYYLIDFAEIFYTILQEKNVRNCDVVVMRARTNIMAKFYRFFTFNTNSRHTEQNEHGNKQMIQVAQEKVKQNWLTADQQ